MSQGAKRPLSGLLAQARGFIADLSFLRDLGHAHGLGLGNLSNLFMARKGQMNLFPAFLFLISFRPIKQKERFIRARASTDRKTGSNGLERQGGVGAR